MKGEINLNLFIKENKQCKYFYPKENTQFICQTLHWYDLLVLPLIIFPFTLSFFSFLVDIFSKSFSSLLVHKFHVGDNDFYLFSTTISMILDICWHFGNNLVHPLMTCFMFMAIGYLTITYFRLRKHWKEKSSYHYVFLQSHLRKRITT